MNFVDPYGLYDWGSEIGSNAVTAVTTVATVAAENAGLIGSGAALGITGGTAMLGDLIFPNSTENYKDWQGWLNNQEQAVEDYKWKKIFERLDSEETNKLIEDIERRIKEEEMRNRKPTLDPMIEK